MVERMANSMVSALWKYLEYIFLWDGSMWRSNIHHRAQCGWPASAQIRQQKWHMLQAKTNVSNCWETSSAWVIPHPLKVTQVRYGGMTAFGHSSHPQQDYVRMSQTFCNVAKRFAKRFVTLCNVLQNVTKRFVTLQHLNTTQLYR